MCLYPQMRIQTKNYFRILYCTRIDVDMKLDVYVGLTIPNGYRDAC